LFFYWCGTNSARESFKSSQKLARLYRVLQIAPYSKFLQSAKMHRQSGSPGSGSSSTSSAFSRIPPVPAQAPASAPPSRKHTAPKAVSFPAWHKHWNRYNTLVSDRFAGDEELGKACGMSHHGTAAVTDFLKGFSHDEVAFLILDRNQGEIRSMDYTELNQVLVDMIPHMSNLTNGKAVPLCSPPCP
jgi:hypothetical protein